MSTTSQVTDFQDLVRDLQNRARETTGVTATENQAKRYINIALHDMHVGQGEKFSWAERGAVLVTQAKYTTGTLVVSQGDTALTGTDTLWDTANAFGIKNMRAGGKIVIDGGEEVYEISSVTDDTNAVLTSDFVKSDVSGGSYVYFEDEYALASDFLRPIDQQSFDDGCSIDLIGRTEFRRRFPRNRTTGNISVGTIIDKPFSGSTTPVRKIRFAPPPDTADMIRYHYVTSNLAVSAAGSEAANLSADDDEPIVPLRYRHAIVLHALARWYRDKKDDVRSREVMEEYTRAMVGIISDNEIGGARAQFRPRVGIYKRRAKRPWGGGTGRYDINGKFDRLEW
jgi:hypothetical protein